MSEKFEQHQIYRDAREHRNAYFEKLTLLDGGTVALVISAVIGPLHGHVKDKYLIGLGLSFLVGAMILLLRRNFLSAEFEFHAAAETSNDQQFMGNVAARKRTNLLMKDIHYTELIGLWMSAIGMVLLLVEVWLILVQSTGIDGAQPAVRWP